MAKETEPRNEAKRAYESVLGYLSEDAQAALFRYLPHLEECVDQEVVKFGNQLADDLNGIVSRESAVVCKRMAEVKNQAERVGEFAKESQNGLDELEKKVEHVAKAASDLDRLASEGASLLGRVQAFATHLAELEVRGAPDGLLWAAKDLRKAYQGWCAVVPGIDGSTDGGAAAQLSKIEGLVEDLASEETHATDEDAEAGGGTDGDAQEGVGTTEERDDAEDSGEERDAEDSGEESTAEEQADVRTEKVDPVAELAESVWTFAGLLQEVQAEQTKALAAKAVGLRQEAAEAAKSHSGWHRALDLLQSGAQETKQIAETAAGDFKDALQSGIAATKLDVLGSTVERGSEKRRWGFWRGRKPR